MVNRTIRTESDRFDGFGRPAEAVGAYFLAALLTVGYQAMVTVLKVVGRGGE